MARTCDARNRFQIFVDCAQITIRPVLILGPRHHLQQITIKRGVEAVFGDSSPVAVGVELVVVNAVPDGIEKFHERSAL
jgi:hypothetical protein